MTDEHDLNLAIARVEGKLDHLLIQQNAIGKQVDSVEDRLRMVEQDTATLKNQAATKSPWAAIVSAVAAVTAIAFVIAEQLFTR